jgi:hypothetical protein
MLKYKRNEIKVDLDKIRVGPSLYSPSKKSGGSTNTLENK